MTIDYVYQSMYCPDDAEKINQEWIILKVSKKLIRDAFGPTKKNIPYDEIMQEVIGEWQYDDGWRFWSKFDQVIENYGGKPSKNMKTGKRVNTYDEQVKDEKQETRLDPQLKRKLK
jgi:hypothetical protein